MKVTFSIIFFRQLKLLNMLSVLSYIIGNYHLLITLIGVDSYYACCTFEQFLLHCIMLILYSCAFNVYCLSTAVRLQAERIKKILTYLLTYMKCILKVITYVPLVHIVHKLIGKTKEVADGMIE